MALSKIFSKDGRPIFQRFGIRSSCEVKDLAEMAVKIEKHYGRPMDRWIGEDLKLPQRLPFLVPPWSFAKKCVVALFVAGFRSFSPCIARRSRSFPCSQDALTVFCCGGLVVFQDVDYVKRVFPSF